MILEVMLPLREKRVLDCHSSPLDYTSHFLMIHLEGGLSGLPNAPGDHIPTFSCSSVSGLERIPAALLGSFSPRLFHLERFQDTSFNKKKKAKRLQQL